jgi:hypothetical protein
MYGHANQLTRLMRSCTTLALKVITLVCVCLLRRKAGSLISTDSTIVMETVSLHVPKLRSSSSSASPTSPRTNVREIEAIGTTAVGRFRNSLTGFALAYDAIRESGLWTRDQALLPTLAFNAAFDGLTIVPCFADIWYAAHLDELLTVLCLAPVQGLRAQIEENIEGILIREIDQLSLAMIEGIGYRMKGALKTAVEDYVGRNPSTVWGIHGLTRAIRDARSDDKRHPEDKGFPMLLADLMMAGVAKKEAMPKLVPGPVANVSIIFSVQEHWDRDKRANQRTSATTKADLEAIE